MHHPFINHLTGGLGEYLYVFVFVSNILESTPIIGTFMPGMVLLILFGFTTYLNGANLAYVILIGFFGAVIGDIIGYLIGKYAGGWMLRHKKLLKEAHIRDGRAFFSKHGGKSILIGRFIGIIRPIVPLIAGSIDMSFRKFIFWNVLGAFLWVSFYSMIGYFFGVHVQEIESVLTGLGWLTIIGLPFAYLFYKKYNKVVIGEEEEK